MIRRAAKVDVCQESVVEELRRAGVEVRVTSSIGAGFPDLLCLFNGRLYLVELKDPESATKADLLDPDHLGMLTPSQVKMRKRWPIIVALTAEEALQKMAGHE